MWNHCSRSIYRPPHLITSKTSDPTSLRLHISIPHFTPHTSHPSPHTPHLRPHTSHPSTHTPHLTSLNSHPTPHTLHLRPHTSHLTPPTSDTTSPNWSSSSCYSHHRHNRQVRLYSLQWALSTVHGYTKVHSHLIPAITYVHIPTYHAYGGVYTIVYAVCNVFVLKAYAIVTYV